MSVVSNHLQHLLGQRGTPLWGGYVNMLKTLESVFLSPKHWILEFLQNAEDASAKRFSIRLGQDSLQILNDGDVFGEDDFYALCDINSRKLPSLGYRGYIGIGFKSIFRITDCIKVHSGNFHFRFEKGYWDDFKREGISISRWPWEILPIETDPEPLQGTHRTGFFVPLESTKGRETIDEIGKFLASSDFPKEAILLLKNVEVIEVQTPLLSFAVTKEAEESETMGSVLPVAKKERVLVRKQIAGQRHPEEARYLVFRKTVGVPTAVRQDGETERVRRSEISECEIGLAFGLDSERNPRALSGKLAGVYSFLPVEGEQTGLPFGIFGDFIPQPGRDLINYGAKWNHWLCEEVADFFRQVVHEAFSAHLLWRFFPAELLGQTQYGSTSGPGKQFWDTRLRDPITQFLEAEALYPDEDGKLRRLDELVIVAEEVVQAVGKDALKARMDKKLVHPSIIRKIQSRIEAIEIYNFSQRRELFELINGQPEKLASIPIETIYDLLYSRNMLEPLKEHPERLAEVYSRIVGLNDYRITGRKGRDRVPLYAVPFVLADDGEFYPPDQMVALEVDAAHVPEFLRLVLPLLKEKKRLHPEIAKDPVALRELVKCRLEIVNKPTVMSKLQQVTQGITSAEKCPETWKYPDDFIQATLSLIAGDGFSGFSIGRLVAQDETLLGPQNLFIPGAPLDWSPLWETHLLPGFQPISERYFTDEWLERNRLQRETIHQYLEGLGVHGFRRDKDDKLIEVAAYAIAKKRLKEEGHILADVTRPKELGYDLQCQGHCGKVFEVKGMAEPHDIELPESETDSAQQKKEDYILICVYHLSSQYDRVGYKRIPNPERLWQPIGRARVPRDKWLRA